GVGRATELRQLGADAGGHLGYGPGGPGQAGSEEEQAGGTGGTVHVDLLVPRGFRSAGRGGGNPGRPASSRLQADQLDTSVGGATMLARVVGDRLVRTETACPQALRGDAFSGQ